MARRFHNDPRAAIEEDVEDHPEESRRQAALLVCSKADSVDDARLLLDMLGLLPTPDQETV